MCNVLEVDNPLNKKKKNRKRGKMPLAPARGVKSRMTLEHESSMELEVTGAAPCSENFLSLVHLFSSLWRVNVLALQCSMLPEHCNNYVQCHMLKNLLEILLN